MTRLVVDNGESGKAGVRAELTAPAGSDGVVTAVGGTAVALRGSLALDDVGAGLGGSSADLNTEVPGAGSVVLVADALKVADSPLGAGGHHGLAGLSWGGNDGRGGEEGGEKDLSDLHCDGLDREFGRLEDEEKIVLKDEIGIVEDEYENSTGTQGYLYLFLNMSNLTDAEPPHRNQS